LYGKRVGLNLPTVVTAAVVGKLNKITQVELGFLCA
jgi:hypothetical protein